MRFAILNQLFPKKAPDGTWQANWRRTGVEIEAETGEEALAKYRSQRSLCIVPLAAEEIK